MLLSRAAIHRPVLTCLLSLALCGLGVAAYWVLPMDMWPEVNIPVIRCVTVWEGASSADVESAITTPIEQRFASLPGVDRLMSFSRDHVSVVVVKLKLEQALDEVVVAMRESLSALQSHFPKGVALPQVSPLRLSELPSLVLRVRARDANMPMNQWLPMVKQSLLPNLRALPGVRMVRLMGEPELEVVAKLLPEALAEAQIPPQRIVELLSSETQDVPAGSVQYQGQSQAVRFLAAPRTLEALAQLPMQVGDDNHVLRLEDLSELSLRPKPNRWMVRSNGREAVEIEVVKTKSVRSLALAAQVRQWIKQQPQAPLDVAVVVDQSQEIAATYHEVEMAIGFGGMMAVLVIFLFLWDVRGTFIAALALPVSVAGTFLCMYFLGLSLNQITLLSLSLAIGLLIDDAVVVRESIGRRLEAGESPQAAALSGTQSIALAVMATTATLLAVFLPMVFMQGMVAQFFRQFGLTMCIAVLFSLLVAFTCDPMLSAHWFAANHHKPLPGKAAVMRFWKSVENIYGYSLAWALSHAGWMVALTFVLLTIGVFGAQRLGVEFLGSQDRNILNVKLNFPHSQTDGLTSAQSQAVETKLAELPYVQEVVAHLGEMGSQVNYRLLLKPAKARDGLNWLTLNDQLRQRLSVWAANATVVVSEPPMMEGVGEWPPIWLQVVGDDWQVLEAQAHNLHRLLQNIAGLVDVSVEPSNMRAEWSVLPRRQVSLSKKMPAVSIGYQLRAYLAGLPAGQLQLHDGTTLPIVVQPKVDANAVWDTAFLKELPLLSEEGVTPLGEVAELSLGSSRVVRVHENGKRQIGITAQLKAGHTLGEVTGEVEQAIAAHAWPQQVQLLRQGQQKDLAEMVASLSLAGALALLFTYIILAAQFESWLQPLTIMLAVPLALLGGVLALVLLVKPLAVGSGIGMVLLMGLVTKNSILLVDGALQCQQLGIESRQAVLQAAPLRLRPILMTTAAMVLGMLPTALSHGVGHEFRAPMASCVIGGVLSSTFLTLWIVPIVFVGLERCKQYWLTKA